MGTLFQVDGSTGSVDFKQNETFNLVLENDTSVPVSGAEGQIFWESDTDILYVHNGTNFVAINGASAGGWTDDGAVVRLTTNTDQVQLGNGLEATPALTFENSSTTGYFRKGADNIGISIAGTEVADWDSGGLNLVDDIQVGGNITVQDTTNQLVLGVTNTVTITSPAPSASRVLTISDPGANASFVMTEGTQTINTALTLGAALAMGSNKITGLSNGTAAQDAAAFGQVTILQAVSASTESTTTTTSDTFVSTNLSASITPQSTSSKILIFVHGNLWSANPALSSGAVATIFRDSTDLGGASSIGMSINRDDDNVPFSSDRPCAMVHSDSPSTTSSTTYSVRIRTRNPSFGASWINAEQKSNIILLEVQG